MKLDRFEAKEGGFTEGALTQSSHLMRLAARQFESSIPDLLPHEIIHLPGQVTAEVRKSWNLMDNLAAVVPEVRGITRDKQAIREVTHLHHAVDAITIGLAAHYLPKDGGIWESLLKREGQRRPEDIARLTKTGVFARASGGRLEMRPPAEGVTRQMENRLKECRVVQHVPAEMNGLPAEMNTWRVASIEGDGASKTAILKQSSTEIKNGVRKRTAKEKSENLLKLVGVAPKGGEGKLSALKGALIIGANYGIALDPVPEMIPFNKVWHQISDLKNRNGGKPVRIIRNGTLIRIRRNPERSKQDYTGVWQVVSVKNNKSGLALDMIRPEYIKAQNKVIWSGMNKMLIPLIDAGLEIVGRRLTGVPKT